ncbi:BON domain-containing protein [Coxiella-like endosymbiont]|uniref:BON domain-containing protein n=1 Tax=Coxiella-like endosymbiont TaxID=1592897 RepID=UPI00272A45A1|nr:BON domain-containing protein [Coxiella-like endosymbiont]
MKKIIILLTLVFLLVGCVPAALVAGVASATLAGAVIYDQRTYRTINQDHNARSIIQYRLDNDPLLNDPLLKGQSHITISVFNNMALLVGQAKTSKIRNRAYQIVEKASHIRRIYNEITIGTPFLRYNKLSIRGSLLKSERLC